MVLGWLIALFIGCVCRLFCGLVCGGLWVLIVVVIGGWLGLVFVWGYCFGFGCLRRCDSFGWL